MWDMKPRKLVEMVFEGLEPPRTPLHVESDDKRFEASISDIVSAGAKIGEWRAFYRLGGPFHRLESESVGEWVDRIELEEYEWPDVSRVVEEALTSFTSRIRGLSEGKFIMFKILGPTETVEAFFISPQEGAHARLGQVAHRFSFGVLYTLDEGKARRVYERVASYILEVVKAGSELEWIDAVRVADDALTYSGPAYSLRFLEELYFPWHSRFSRAVHKRGKYFILHCDGDVRKKGFMERLLTMYDGLHPLDLSPKSTLEDSAKWVLEVANLRKLVDEDIVFFTGIPVDLIFNDDVGVCEVVEIPLLLLRMHGSRSLVIATTHSEYPARSYSEELPRRKVEAIREALEVFSC